MITFWANVDEAVLAQGDFLRGCRVPVLPLDFDMTDQTTAELDKADLIIVTQSCDLANLNVGFVALCPIHSLSRFRRSKPEFQKEGAMGTGQERASRGPASPGLAARPREQPRGARRGFPPDLQSTIQLSNQTRGRRSAIVIGSSRHFLNTSPRHLRDSLCESDYRHRSQRTNDPRGGRFTGPG